MFPNASIPVQGGSFVFSSSFPVYSSNAVTQRFTLLSAVAAGLQVQWYGHLKGSPTTPIQGILVRVSTGLVVGTSTMAASAITGKDQWQAAFSFAGAFPADQYQLTLSTLGGDASNNYQVWLLADLISDGYAVYNAGVNSSSGNSVLWVKDSVGNTVALYPYEALNDGHLAPVFPQIFIAPISFSSQALVIFIGDRHWDQTTSSLTVTDVSTSAALATATLDQNIVQGRQGMVPLQLSQPINFIAGKSYRVDGPSGANITWAIAIRGTYVDPPPSVLDYEIPSSQFVPMFSDLCTPLEDTTGQDAISGTISSGVMFSPTANGTLNEFHVLMKGFGVAGNYNPGDTLSVSVYANFPQAGAPFNHPTGAPLQAVSIPSQNVPKFGFLDAAGFSLPLTAGTKYWAVLSLNPTSAQTMYQARLINPYRFEVLRTYPGQVPLWNYDGEGPTDWSFRVVTSAEQIGNFITDIPYVLAAPPSGAIAQPFVAPKSMTINGISFGGGFKLDGPWNSYVTISINPDVGGFPSANMLGSGKFRVSEQSWPGTEYVGFDTAAALSAGQKYWVVITPNAGVTTMGVVAIVYYIQPAGWPAGLNALVNKSGLGYAAIVGPGTTYPTSVAAIIPFWLAAQIGGTTTIPTTVTVTARPH